MGIHQPAMKTNIHHTAFLIIGVLFLCIISVNSQEEDTKTFGLINNLLHGNNGGYYNGGYNALDAFYNPGGGYTRSCAARWDAAYGNYCNCCLFYYGRKVGYKNYPRSYC